VKHEDPLHKIEEVRKRLGAPRVNVSVLWTVVVQLAADLTWALAQIDTLRDEVRVLRRALDEPEPTYYVAPVGGSDSVAACDEEERLF